MRTLHGAAIFASGLLLVAGCATGAPTIGPASLVPTTAATAPAATPSPAPTADLAHPVGLIAIGHSGLTGEGTVPEGRPNAAASWATGTDPAVNSVYLRLVVALPATERHVANAAVGGASASALTAQAQVALAQVPAPALAIVQTVDNDILCDGSNIADVGALVATALTFIHDASPNTKILVVGQAGRPSVAFLKSLVAFDPNAISTLTWDDECTFYTRDGKLNEPGVQKLSAVIDAYEAETARVCALVPNCTTDGGVRRTWVDKIELFSPDYAHLNGAGQAAEAELIWPVVKQVLGL